MKIEFDFRSDMTVCELLQYLNDELQIQAHCTDMDIFGCDEYRSESMTWKIEESIKRENKLVDLIDDIAMYASFVDIKHDF